MSTHESMIAASVERMLDDTVTADGFDARLWSALAGAGVPRLLRPETQGGAGDAWRDAAAVLQATAGRAAPVPLADALLAHAWLARAGLDADDGPIALAIATPHGRPDNGDGSAPAGAALLRVDPWGASLHGEWCPPGAAPIAFEGPDAGRARAELALVAASMLTGALRAAIAMGVEYAGLRRAFGRTIGTFQAVQHPLAVAAEEVAAARAALDWAADALEAGDAAAPVASAVAKARASDAAGRVAATVHQVHGAIGFTAEHPLHRLTRRLWVWRDRWGDEHDWHERLGALALAAGPEGLFDLLDGTAPGASHPSDHRSTP